MDHTKSSLSQHYLFAALEGAVVREAVRLDAEAGSARNAMRRVWPDFELNSLLNRSLGTVKADAAHSAFSALGEGITWAIIDSGIDAKHRHFLQHENLSMSTLHMSFVGDDSPLEDHYGHGTHIAGIIGGGLSRGAPEIRAMKRSRDEDANIVYNILTLDEISSMAPQCKLVSLKVLDDRGSGSASTLIAALEYIQLVNEYGRRIRIHGANISVGYPFRPEWLISGPSPVSVEANRLASSGVVVVTAAGNDGAAGESTIDEPGIAEEAITVGSTHREAPLLYGVSTFSSKGPTSDGRVKPDLVAPGERILSCAAGERVQPAVRGDGVDYIEGVGTSVAAAHVSGVIAAFLSVRPDFVGRPREIKEIFSSTAVNLGRVAHFQGHGLVNLMHALLYSYGEGEEALAQMSQKKVALAQMSQKKVAPPAQEDRGREITEHDNRVNIFYSYAHKDRRFREDLEIRLSLLRREGRIREWSDRMIGAGEEWRAAIADGLNDAHIILLLVSPDFLASDYSYDIEVVRAISRHESGAARVIPIILKPVDWQGAPFGKLQALPRDGKPITNWRNRDEAWMDVVRGLRKVIEALRPLSSD